MWIFSKIKPKFWDHLETSRSTEKFVFNFRRIWQIVVVLTILVALIPLAILAVIDYRVSREAIKSETILRLSRLVSNTGRSVSYFIDERVSALNYLNLSKSYETLRDTTELAKTLTDMQKSFGGIVDLGVIDDQGRQIAYTGPYSLEGVNYKESEWFKTVDLEGICVSDVFEGYRNVPHLIIAIKHEDPGGGYYVLRATLELRRLGDMLSSLEIEKGEDIFLLNRQGILQTPSRYYGGVLDPLNLTLPDFPDSNWIEGFQQTENDSLLIEYSYINPDNPLVLMIVKPKDQMMETWNQSKLRIFGILVVSVIIIVVVILGGTTYLVSQIYQADQRRLTAMHKIEYAHKMASLGQLSAGIAHEINNPLAVIGEKAGLAMDLIMIRNKREEDAKLAQIIDSIISSVDRCANITHRLLSFARRSEVKRGSFSLAEIVEEVLGFMGKEASYRAIEIEVESDDDVPPVESDRGRLQEILLNLFTNAFSAMDDGGKLTITISNIPPDKVTLSCTDTGRGIPKDHLERIFEPFFSTTTGKGGTGLGLSITYRLLEEIGGRIRVQSQVGVGTTFTITLPAAAPAASTTETRRSNLV